jgi:hypothetical protein
MPESASDRFQLSQKLASVKQNVARAITEEFFVNHPDWGVRYGDRGRQFCTADACFHMEFLAGAIEAGSPEAFADYSRWTTRSLSEYSPTSRVQTKQNRYIMFYAKGLPNLPS